MYSQQLRSGVTVSVDSSARRVDADEHFIFRCGDLDDDVDLFAKRIDLVSSQARMEIEDEYRAVVGFVGFYFGKLLPLLLRQQIAFHFVNAIGQILIQMDKLQLGIALLLAASLPPHKPQERQQSRR